MEILFDIAVPVVQALVTTAAGVATQLATEKAAEKKIQKRVFALSDEEQENDELVDKIIMGELRKQKFATVAITAVEAALLGAGATVVGDMLSSSGECDSTDDTATDDTTADEAAFR